MKTYISKDLSDNIEGVVVNAITEQEAINKVKLAIEQNGYLVNIDKIVVEEVKDSIFID